MVSDSTWLTSGEITVIGRIADASNATLLAEIANSKVVYKPVAGERPLWDFPDGNLASREYAAYHVSEMLGLGVVPRTVFRDGPYGSGIVQEWIEEDPEIDIVELAQTDSDSIRKIAFYDLLINNGDRKFGHLLAVSPDHIYAIDHGVTFNSENKLRTVLWQWAGKEFSEIERNLLKKFLEIFESSDVNGLITDREIEATISRVSNLQDADTFPYPSPDWPAVPWPPF